MNKEDFIRYCTEIGQKVKGAIEKLEGDKLLEEQCGLLKVCNGALELIKSEVSEENKVSEKFLDLIHAQIESYHLSSIRPEHLPNDWKISDGDKNFIININNVVIKTIDSIDKIEFYYHLLKSIALNNRNIVIVGANGSGKTTLASYLKKNIGYRDGIVISAQKIIFIPTFPNTPSYEPAMRKLNEVQNRVYSDKISYSSKGIDDTPFGEMRSYAEDSIVVVGALLADRRHRQSEYFKKKKAGEPIEDKDLSDNIDHIINIWNDLICDRTLSLNDDTNTFKILHNGQNYPAFCMSDGEREIFYMAAKVLQAAPDSIIFVDEPENHLHRTIVDKLWNKMEEVRNDCTFVYLTHDLQFATSRNADIRWIRSFEFPEKWDIQPLEKNDIPEDVLLTLLGSKRKVLFCEGKNGSFDKQFYEILFPCFTIQPVESCANVINYTKAFNQMPNKNVEAFGIVDRDFRTQPEIESLEQAHIYCYDVAEIENLFLVEDFLRLFVEYIHADINTIEEIKKKVISVLDDQKDQQTYKYVSAQIQYRFKSIDFNSADTEENVKQNFNNYISEVKIEDWANERLTEINKTINNSDYSKAIRIFNNKGLAGYIAKTLGLADKKFFHERALKFLASPESIAARDVLRNIFPDAISQTNIGK